MSLIDALKDITTKNSKQLIYHRIAPDHVVDRVVDETPLVAGRDYIRLWLEGMFLQSHVRWFTTWQPAVHAVVRLTFGDQQKELPTIADWNRVGMQKDGKGDVVAGRFQLTPTMPFNGGTVELDAGLMAIAGQNVVIDFISVLGSFSKALAVPQLSTVLNIAQPLADGMQKLFGLQGNQLHLGLHDSLATDNVKPGYLVAIRATAQEVDPNKLWVSQDRLHVGEGRGPGQYAPFARSDYMLVRLEGFQERDDWDSLTTIQKAYEDARRALLQDLDEAKAQTLLRMALVRVLEAPELTVADRRRVVAALKARFEQDKEDVGVSGLTGQAAPALSTLVQRYGMPINQAHALGALTEAEIFTKL